LGNRFAGKITQQLKKLAEAKITVHCQAVVVPNKNDGDNLAYTAKKLFEMYPYVADLAVVPTGITKYREGLTHIDNITPESASAVLDLCDSLNKQFGVNFLLPADEYFVRCGREMKDETFYGDFSQIENGIGMTTKFISDFNASKHPATLKHPKRVAVVTGVSACGTIERLCKEANKLVVGLHAFALPVVNVFFGDSVTCTGLLTGQDILNELQKNSLAFDSVIIPANTLKQFEDVFLDDMTVKDLQKALKHKKVLINREADTFFESLLKA
jgi:NifB/MoaA-like Fe-S oxidoreductase